jgi:hypothetical protein
MTIDCHFGESKRRLRPPSSMCQKQATSLSSGGIDHLARCQNLALSPGISQRFLLDKVDRAPVTRRQLLFHTEHIVQIESQSWLKANEEIQI